MYVALTYIPGGGLLSLWYSQRKWEREARFLGPQGAYHSAQSE